MAFQNLSENIILVDLAGEPQMRDELKTITDMVADRRDCDVIIDFSGVDIVTSSSLSSLLRLRQLLVDCGHRLVFCGVAPFTRSTFSVTGLDGIFELAEDRTAAAAVLQCAGQPGNTQ